MLRITVSVDTVSLDDESDVIAHLNDDEMAIGSAALFCIAACFAEKLILFYILIKMITGI